MPTALSISLIALCALAALETAVLRAVLRETAWLARLHRRTPAPRDSMEEALGTVLPVFSLPALDGEEFLTHGDVRGRFAIFLFLARADIASADDAEVRSMVNGLLSHAEECLYLVCEGKQQDARWIRDRWRISQIYGSYVRIVVDETARLRRLLKITSTPSCAIFDEEGSLKRVGHPLSSRAPKETARHAA